MSGTKRRCCSITRQLDRKNRRLTRRSRRQCAVNWVLVWQKSTLDSAGENQLHCHAKYWYVILAIDDTERQTKQTMVYNKRYASFCNKGITSAQHTPSLCSILNWRCDGVDQTNQINVARSKFCFCGKNLISLAQCSLKIYMIMID